MSATPRWGSAAIDLGARDLPALKASFLIRHAPSHGKLLELGCGEGKILRTLLREKPALRLLGCDVRDVSPNDGAFEFRRIAPARSGPQRIPAADGELDAVLLSDVLEHTPDPAATLAELWRVLRPGGSLVGFVPLEGERWSAYALCRALWGQDLYLHTKQHVQSFTLADARALLGGFRILEERFAYHLLGQTMDASFFAATRVPRLARFWWTENRYYVAPATSGQRPALLPRALNRLLELGNRVAHAESSLLGRVPWFSAGLLFAARRP